METITKKYELDNFQKEACNHIDNGYNILVSAPTGSGKTAIAEYGIEFTKHKNINSKIIYTCPIKSLCNEKYRDMTLYYTSYKIGLMTGDIIINPDGDIIIMTTEVLYNLMTNKSNQENDNQENTNKIKMDTELFSCIIFDEVHYINDDSRGHVWEKCIINSLISYNSLLILLSATIGNIDELLSWLNTINLEKQFRKIVKYERPVPLIEYVIDNTKCRTLKKNTINLNESDVTCNEDKVVVNTTPDEDSYELLRLNDINYNRVKKYWIKLDEYNYSVNFELETLCNQIKLNPNLGIPAIIFVLSKNKCIEYAEMISTSFVNHEEQSKIIQFYDYNLSEFKHNSQYIDLRKTILKGIAYHHSGLIPKIREVVEFLIKNKLIKIVFATETFAVGLNFPVKTVVLTSLRKPTERGFRNLYVSEYKQMAGRAGRRFLDNVGNVIIWLYHKSKSNKDPYPIWSEINNITNGPIDMIESKYVVEPNYILKNITTNIYRNITDQSFKYYKMNKEITNMNLFDVPDKYKKIFEIEKKMIEFGKQNISYVDKNYNKILQKFSKEDKAEYNKLLSVYKSKSQKSEYELYIDFENSLINFLINNNFIIKNDNIYYLTDKGNLAYLFNEINPVFFVDNIEYILSNKNNILPILSMFIDDGVKENDNTIVTYDDTVLYFKEIIKEKYDNYFNKYPKWVFMPLNYNIVKSWLEDDKITLDDIIQMYEVDMGLMVKILIKMYQICDELLVKLIKLNRTDLTEFLSNQKDLLIRHPLKIDSLYINN